MLSIHRQLLPELTPSALQLLESLVDASAVPLTTSRLCALAGVRGRHALYRRLQRERLPSIRQLIGALNLLSWSSAWNREGRSLAAQALAAGKDPAACYRTVVRVTGRRWSEIKGLGREEILALTLQRVRREGSSAAQSMVGRGVS